MAMSSIPMKELRQKSQAELLKLLDEARRQVHEVSFQAASKQLKDVSVVKKSKQQVARVLTALREHRTS